MKKRILCLHGKQQNSNIFRTKMGRIPHKLRNITDFILVDAPHIINDNNNDKTMVEADIDTSSRTWFTRDELNNSIEEGSVISTLEYIKTIWIDKGPFEGILGFSMGGMIATIIALMSLHFFQFLIHRQRQCHERIEWKAMELK